MGVTERDIDILYVEDDEVDIKNMQREFKKVNDLLQIVVARSGGQALDMLYGRNEESKIHPKIILLDINMPKMSGIEFLQTLRSNPDFTDIDVFILTGSFGTEDKLAMEGMNVRGHIIKPLQYGDALNVFWTLQT
ncbi:MULTISPECIES: response regulator [Legionella]|uniref:Response regulator n=1 Tax=Legionella septentrionalis TaxID=2498109 RepID=A0A3S0VMM5_9GAMM|nr:MULTISPECIES: response regulator [Legionella]MCP0912944.1 response regulator [Legionella sp. 27cVA30]RUQ84525.1 response regulator [Legionella septentrionalis]RUQ96763.1 response regulator [Legionella septentrionalis]RUR10131.1 response regulator [Legionella septentrionalis]RUR15477.1 response regulator [Legionella septentrionalis]